MIATAGPLRRLDQPFSAASSLTCAMCAGGPYTSTTCSPACRLTSSAGVPWALIAEDPDATWAAIGEHVLYQRRTANQFLTANGHPALYPGLPDEATQDRSWNPDIVVTPARARELVVQAAEQAQTDEVSVAWYGIPPGVPPALCQRSLELFAAEMLTGAR